MIRTPTRAAVYCRISQDRDGEALGVERQRVDCEALVEGKGWDLAAVYQDNDISAYSGKTRPAYVKLLHDMRSGQVDAVVAWHPDRLHRSTRELEDFIDTVEARRIAVATVTAGAYDLTTPSGRMTAKIIGAVAQQESEHKAERIRRKHQERADNGLPGRNSTRPYGLTKDWSEIVSDEATLIHEAVAHVLGGGTIAGLCQEWNDRGLVTSTGGRWQPSPLKRMLTSGRLAGVREYRGKVTTGTWPAIVSLVTLEQLRTILNDPGRRTSTSNARSYLLSGFLRCHACGAKMVARPRADHVRRYVCAKGPATQGCGKTYIVAEPVEELVSQMVVAAIDSPALDDLMAARRGAKGPDIADLTRQVGRAEARRNALAEDFADEAITRSEYLAGRDRVTTRINGLGREISEATSHGVLASVVGAARQDWTKLDFDKRRAVIGAVVDHVVIGPGRQGWNHFDAGRLTVVWQV